VKFVVGWRGRQGRSAKKRRRDHRRARDAFVRWLTPDDQVIHQNVVRVDGRGGLAVIETDRAAGLLESVAKFSPWFEFDVFPVVDVADAVGVFDTAASWLDFVSTSRLREQQPKHQKNEKQQKKRKKNKKDKKRAKPDRKHDRKKDRKHDRKKR
jgi:hypothetical protein